MKEFLGHPVFAIVAEEAARLNVDAYVIGGFVRDALLKRPCKDIDIVAVSHDQSVKAVGIVLAEAMASGKVVAAAGNAGYRSVLEGRFPEALFPPGDAEALKLRLLALMRERARWNDIGIAARAEAARHDARALSPAFVDVYERAAQRA